AQASTLHRLENVGSVTRYFIDHSELFRYYRGTPLTGYKAGIAYGNNQTAAAGVRMLGVRMAETFAVPHATFLGDSLTAGVIPPEDGSQIAFRETWPYLLAQLGAGAFHTSNMGVGGNKVADMAARQSSTSSSPFYK